MGIARTLACSGEDIETLSRSDLELEEMCPTCQYLRMSDQLENLEVWRFDMGVRRNGWVGIRRNK